MDRRTRSLRAVLIPAVGHIVEAAAGVVLLQTVPGVAVTGRDTQGSDDRKCRLSEQSRRQAIVRTRLVHIVTIAAWGESAGWCVRDEGAPRRTGLREQRRRHRHDARGLLHNQRFVNLLMPQESTQDPFPRTVACR